MRLLLSLAAVAIAKERVTEVNEVKLGPTHLFGPELRLGPVRGTIVDHI